MNVDKKYLKICRKDPTFQTFVEKIFKNLQLKITYCAFLARRRVSS